MARPKPCASRGRNLVSARAPPPASFCAGLRLLFRAARLFHTGAPFALFQAFFDQPVALDSVAHALRVAGFLGEVEGHAELLGDHVDPLRPADLAPRPVARTVDENDRHLVDDGFGFHETLHPASPPAVLRGPGAQVLQIACADGVSGRAWWLGLILAGSAKKIEHK